MLQVPWEEWTTWTGAWEPGGAFVCRPSYEEMCPCSALTIAVGDETEIAGWNSYKLDFLGYWYRIPDPGNSENAGRPVFANDRNNYKVSRPHALQPVGLLCFLVAVAPR